LGGRFDGGDKARLQREWEEAEDFFMEGRLNARHFDRLETKKKRRMQNQ
jgi:hypothetical protein